MKYIYNSAKFNRKMCEIFEVAYTPSKPDRIQVDKINSIAPVNLGIDIGVVGKEPWNKGKKTGSLSDEHKLALSIAGKSYEKTQEHRKKLSESLKGNKNDIKPKSQEHKEKIRQSILKRKMK